MPFLDVIIHHEGPRFSFEIYRKLTNLNSYIHNFSSHQFKIKQSVYRGMFYRALSIVSPQYLNDEIKFIYQIGYNHKYNKSFLDRCLSLAQRSFYGGNKPKIDRQDKHSDTVILPFHNNFLIFPRLFKYLKINLVFNYKQTIRQLLIKHSPLIQMGGIYRIDCVDCDRFYIGQTGRDIKKRVKEHAYAVRMGNNANAIFLHMSSKNHRMNVQGARVIKMCNTYVNRNVIESCMIDFTWDKNVNISNGLFGIDKIACHLFDKQLNFERMLHI
jgi:hypothetical protein